MKKFTIALLLLMSFLTMLVISNPGHAAVDKVILRIEGMTWASWPLIVKKALEGLEGVEKANISFREKRGEVFFDPDKVTETDMVKKVKQIGFRATVLEK